MEATFATVIGILVGTGLLAIVVLILGFLLIGVLSPLGGFIAHEREVHVRPARSVRTHSQRAVLHH